jgi:sec-independent protein translocase protein TatC
MRSDELSFWDHLDELRSVLFRTLGVLAVLSVGFFILMPHIFDTVIMGPCFGDFITYQWFCTAASLVNTPSDFCDPTFVINIINIELTTPFMVHIQTSFVLAVLLAFPYLLFEIWRFIRPALYEAERRNLSGAFLLGAVLFYCGVAMSYYFIFPITLRFLAGYEVSQLVSNQLSLQSYMSTFTGMNLVLGITFEMPMLAMILSKFGLVTRGFFRKYRRHAIVGLVFIAAVITPTGDPFTLTLVSVPLYLLYELSALLVKKDPEIK